MTSREFSASNTGRDVDRIVEVKGFSLIELLVAMGVALALVASALTIVNRMQVGFATEGERSDMQQRLRAASDALVKDLVMAGAGAYQGAFIGPLNSFLASVLPYRSGATKADPPGAFSTNTISVFFVPPATAAQSTIGQPIQAQSGSVSINLDPGCPPIDTVCGFAAGMDVMIYDETASYDTFRIVSVQPGSVQMQHTMTDGSHLYATGSKIVEVASHTYYLKAEPASDTYQLMHYDGVNSEAAVVDHVIAMEFEYYGEPAPPTFVKAPTEPVGPWTTYGPRPPGSGAPTEYPSGENCLFQLDGAGVPIPRLAFLGAEGETALVRLTATQLTDGPWCPDAASPHRYDADLLRIRRIAVRLRLETPQIALRGPAGVLFSHGGSSRDPTRWVPDAEIRFDVSPRNLNLSR
jgi:type II secretory pathway pseudopilin PulG